MALTTCYQFWFQKCWSKGKMSIFALMKFGGISSRGWQSPSVLLWQFLIRYRKLTACPPVTGAPWVPAMITTHRRANGTVSFVYRSLLGKTKKQAEILSDGFCCGETGSLLHLTRGWINPHNCWKKTWLGVSGVMKMVIIKPGHLTYGKGDNPQKGKSIIYSTV